MAGTRLGQPELLLENESSGCASARCSLLEAPTRSAPGAHVRAKVRLAAPRADQYRCPGGRHLHSFRSAYRALFGHEARYRRACRGHLPGLRLRFPAPPPDPRSNTASDASRCKSPYGSDRARSFPRPLRFAIRASSAPARTSLLGQKLPDESQDPCQASLPRPRCRRFAARSARSHSPRCARSNCAEHPRRSNFCNPGGNGRQRWCVKEVTCLSWSWNGGTTLFSHSGISPGGQHLQRSSTHAAPHVPYNSG